MFFDDDAEQSEKSFSIDKLTRRMPGGFFIYHATGDEKLLYANDILLELHFFSN